MDAINFLELWTCKSGNNSSNYCDKDYDALVEQARSTQDDQARYETYAQLEQKLLGEDGAIPVVPIYWYTYPNLEQLSIKDSFTVNLLSQIDLTKAPSGSSKALPPPVTPGGRGLSSPSPASSS